MPKVTISAEDLAVVRGQLVTLKRFVEKALAAAGHTWEDWGIGAALPAYPLEYDPVEWQEENWPIWKAWDSARRNVLEYCPELHLEALSLERVKCADLLDLSENVSWNVEDYI